MTNSIMQRIKALTTERETLLAKGQRQELTADDRARLRDIALALDAVYAEKRRPPSADGPHAPAVAKGKYRP